MLPHKLARRMARGVTQPTTHANLPASSLFNNSTGAYMLAVYDIVLANANDFAPAVYILSRNGVFGSFDSAGIPIVTDGAVLAGQLYYGEESALPRPDYVLQSSNAINQRWVREFPFAIVLPGWSLEVVVDTNPGNPYPVGFFWAVIEAQNLEHYYGEL